MRFLYLSVLLASLVALALGWGSNIEREAYNRWHQSELERWLQDRNIPFPSAASRRDLENLVQRNWDDFTSANFFQGWSDNRLADFVRAKTGNQPENTFDRDNLVRQIEGLWSDGWSRLPTERWGDVKSWVFDTWSDSQIRQFLEYHNIVAPTPLTTREKLVQAAKDNYNEIAKRFGEEEDGSFYPGDWLYASWSDSELRSWLVDHGWMDNNTDTPTQTRDNLLVSMRTNWLYDRILGDWRQFKDAVATASSAVSDSATSVTDAAQRSVAAASREAAKEARISSSKARRESLSLSSAASKAAAEASRSSAALESAIANSWTVDQLRHWADGHGIPLPDGIQQNELRALVWRHQHSILKQAATATQTVASAYGAATSSAGNEFSKATQAAADYLRGAADRLKEAFGVDGTATAPTQIDRLDL